MSDVRCSPGRFGARADAPYSSYNKGVLRGWEETFLKYVGAVGRLSQAGVRAVCRVQPSAGGFSRFGRLGRITLRALLHRCLVERLSPAGAGAEPERSRSGGGAVTGDGPGASGPAEEAGSATRFADEGSDRNDGEVCDRDCGRGGNDRNDRKRGRKPCLRPSSAYSRKSSSSPGLTSKGSRPCLKIRIGRLPSSSRRPSS